MEYHYIKNAERKNMRKQGIVKDKQKLFKKLFISPSYSEPLDPPLLVSPDFIYLLLQQSANASRNYQLSLINDILNAFTQRPTNSLLLYSHDEFKIESQKCICDSIVMRILNLIQTYQEVELYLERIVLMISYYRISLRNIQKLTQWLSKMTYLEKFNSIKFMFIVRLLRLYYLKKIGEIKSPMHYFYIYGTDNSGIQSISHGINEISIKNELTFVLSFTSHGAPYKLYNLLFMKTEKKQQFGVTYFDGCLKITSLYDGLFIDEFIIRKQLCQQVWYRIIINMTTMVTQCILNNQTYTGVPLMKKQKQRKITQCIFGRQFFGMIGNAFISNKSIPLQKFDMNTYPYGVDSIDHLIKLNKTSIPSGVILSCLPFWTFEVREVLHCFDIFQRNHSTISDNIVVVGQALSGDSLDHLGGCRMVLPLFYLARFYDKEEYPSMLEDLLSIVLQILQTYNTQKIETQFQQSHFIQILGEHLSDISYLQSHQSLNLIFAIYKTFKKEKTKLTYIHDLIWSLNIGIETSHAGEEKQGEEKEEFSLEELKDYKGKQNKGKNQMDEEQILIKYYYKLIVTLYETQSSIAYKSMTFAEVTYWAVQHLQSNQKIIYCCCFQHHLNETLLIHEIGSKELIKMNNSRLRVHYHELEEILARYLENFVRRNDGELSQQFKILLRLLLQKYSACFYLMVLKVIRRQIMIFDKKVIGPILSSPKLEMLSFLIFLSQKTINPDILSQILSLLLFVQKHTTMKKKQQIVKCIIDFLKVNQDIVIRNNNPIKKLIQRMRKYSAPSLYHRPSTQPQDCLNQSFSHFRRKSPIIQTNKRQIFGIIGKIPKPQKLSNYQPFYNLIMNQLSDIISLDEPSAKQIHYSEQSILITKQYYKLVQPLLKQKILLFLLGSLQKNSLLRNSSALRIFLLECLKQAIGKSSEEAKSLLTIFTCIFSQVISNHGSIVDLYSSIKFLKYSRKAISIILPHIICKVIKIVDLAQLCDLMLICLYQIIEDSNESSYEVANIVLCEFNEKILKLIEGVNKKKMGGEEDGGGSYENRIVEICGILCKVLYENPEKDGICADGLDPFEEEEVIKRSLLSMQTQTEQLQNSKVGTVQLNPNDLEKRDNQSGVESIITEPPFEQIYEYQNKTKQNGENQWIAIPSSFQSNQYLQLKNEKQKNKYPQKDRTNDLPNKNLDNSYRRQKQKQKQKTNQKKIQKLSNMKQLTVIEVYIKLFFKTAEKKNRVQKNYVIKESTEGGNQNGEQAQHVINNVKGQKTRKKSMELSYFYQLKSKQKLNNQFIEIITLFFKNTLYNSLNIQNRFIKCLLTFILYKISFLKLKPEIESINVHSILESIFENTILPFMGKEVKDLTELYNAITNVGGNGVFLGFFSQKPLKYSFEEMAGWCCDRMMMIESLNNRVLDEIFAKEDRYEKYLKVVEDYHDLLIVSLFKRNMQVYIDSNEKLMVSLDGEKNAKSIQKLFDVENAAEEKTRITFLYENQCRFRKYHYQWDKIWNKLRIYHQPYGFWMAQKYKDNIYTYPKNSVINFKFIMSEYSNQSNIYPILQAQIIEPWNIVKDNRIKKNIYINSFSEMLKPNHLKVEKHSNQNPNNLLTSLWRGMIGFSKRNLNLNFSFYNRSKQKAKEYDVVYISRSTKASGKLFIQNKQEILFLYQGARQEDTHLSFQKFLLAFNRETYQKWSLYSIQKIRVHRYLLRNSALQMVLSEGRSVIFNFVKNDKQQFIKQIEKIVRQKLNVQTQKLYKLNKVPLFRSNFFQFPGIDGKITEKWIKREISNLRYLVEINRVASRGIFDLSQYMVVPWVVEFKREKEPKYRDLTKTMGGLGSEQRKKIISEKYFTKDPFNPYPPFFFGTHYSSPGVVFNFLIRLSPFAEYCKHLQGGKFDIPDRLFSSLISAWRSASQEVSDVRQLIPQLYYLPQILINIDGYYFGFTQNGQLINHVELPPWGAHNPYYFTSQIRQIMESEEVSEKLNQWIDLIFGYKQKGKEAEDNFNVYYYLTYEDNVNLEGDDDDIYVKSKQAQIVHFGQIPPLIFDKPHPKRSWPLSDSIYQLKIVKTVNLMTSFKQKPIGIKIVNNQLTLIKRNQIEVYSLQSNPASLQKRKKFNLQKSISNTYYVIKKQKSSVQFFQRNYFIIWGYFNNEFRIFNKNSGEINQYDQVNSKILSLIISKNQDLILVGTLSGVLYIYEIEYGLSSILIKKIGIEIFPAPIVFISQYDGFFAITFGNYAAIYKIHRSLHYLTSQQTKISIKFFRSFSNVLPLKASYIMTSPLYTIILIDNANIKSYSINGQFIKSVNSSAKYYDRFRDNQLHDVFYAIDQDKVICYSVPDLRNISILDLPQHEQMLEHYILHKSAIEEIGYGCD